MKNLFIYYSLTGNGDKVAEELKKQKYELEDFDTNLEGYDKIAIGSPVWDDRLAPATNAL